MKIKELIGEDATAVIKDYKPGQMVSIVDPATDTMTTVDLKKNPMALKPNDQGQLVYDPTPDNAAGASGTGEKPAAEIKPGAQVSIDTATSEGMGTTVLASLAVIAGLLGINYSQQQSAYEQSPQLQKLVKMHAEYTAKGDEEAVKQLERRIGDHKTRLDLGKGDVMGKDGKPVDPVAPTIFSKSQSSVKEMAMLRKLAGL
jgi:hypothetical protein